MESQPIPLSIGIACFFLLLNLVMIWGKEHKSGAGDGGKTHAPGKLVQIMRRSFLKKKGEFTDCNPKKEKRNPCLFAFCPGSEDD